MGRQSAKSRQESGGVWAVICPGKQYFANPLDSSDRLEAYFTPRRSLVRSQYRPPGQRLCGSPSSSRWEPFHRYSHTSECAMSECAM
jgi:hypothetical protein